MIGQKKYADNQTKNSNSNFHRFVRKYLSTNIRKIAN